MLDADFIEVDDLFIENKIFEYALMSMPRCERENVTAIKTALIALGLDPTPASACRDACVSSHPEELICQMVFQRLVTRWNSSQCDCGLCSRHRF